jgi:hypothetical protein
MNNLLSLEKDVIDKLLEGDEGFLEGLRLQMNFLRVISRKFTGAGFVTTFEIATTAPQPRQMTSKLGDVSAEIEGLQHGAGFLLSVENGYLHSLEGFTYDEAWPSKIEHFELRYLPHATRDLKKLHDKLHGSSDAIA